MTKFGLALGGGGVKGLAHIALLKKLDQLEIKPHSISGTSMGAIIGALYAAGLSGEEIEERVKSHLFSSKDGLKKTYERRRHLVKWVKVFALEKSRGGLFTAEGLFDHLFTEIRELYFKDLNIPFTAVATNFHSGKEVALNSGPLLDSVRASMAVPGIFAPVTVNEQLLIDGGLVNNVPYEYVSSKNGLIVASDVISLSQTSEPKMTQVLTGALSIMLRSATEQKFALYPPDFIFRPNTDNIDAFDFHKIAKVLDRGDKEIAKVEKFIEKILE